MDKQVIVPRVHGVLIPMGATCAPVAMNMKIFLLILQADLAEYVNVRSLISNIFDYTHGMLLEIHYYSWYTNFCGCHGKYRSKNLMNICHQIYMH